MTGYSYMVERDDGDFNMVEVNTETGEERIEKVIPKADKDYPFGRPDPEMIASSYRADRNNLLAQTDHWALADRTITSSQTAYRQALRDLPNHSKWPNLSVEDWPIKPD